MALPGWLPLKLPFAVSIHKATAVIAAKVVYVKAEKINHSSHLG